jgi:hypothetical protein
VLFAAAAARAELQNALHTVLDAQAAMTQDDIEAALADAGTRAEDLQAELTSLLSVAAQASDWKAREQVGLGGGGSCLEGGGLPGDMMT